MATLNGGRLVAKALKKEGVEVVFTLTGGHITPMFYGCFEEGIDVIDVRHETSAVLAADSYAKITGKPAVVMTTAGPGVINTTTGMAEALHSGTPVVHIGGASPLAVVETGALQCTDTVAIMATVSKWAKRAYSLDRVGELITMAFRHAMDDTPGPVYLEIAQDVLNGVMEEGDFLIPKNSRTDTQPFGDPAMIKQAAQALANAKKPAIVIGDQARFSFDGTDTVRQLSNYLQAPTMVFNTSRGHFAPESDPLFSMYGKCLSAADVILELGVHNHYRIAKGRAPRVNGEATIIQVNTDKSKIGFNTRADIGIVAGTSAAAAQILEIVKTLTGPKTGWKEEAEALNKEYADKINAGATSDVLPMHPARPAAECAKFIATEGKDWSVICDGGEASLWSLTLCKANYPGQVLTFGPLATIGTGAGYALGAAVARKKPVLYYTGDGSFGFYPMEFDTFMRHDLQVICVIANDSQWGMIKMLEAMRKKDILEKTDSMTMKLAKFQPYHKLADVIGGIGIECHKPEEIIPAIRRVYESGKSGIINVEINDKDLSPITLNGMTNLA